MNEDNLKGHGFNERTASERREIAIKAGKASGEARRKKANFKRILNMLLTTEIDNPDITPQLEALGLDSTLESAVNMAIIKEAMMGDVKAYIAIRDTLGQGTDTDAAIEKQRLEIEKQQLEIERLRNSINPQEEYESDGFMDALKGDVVETFAEAGGIVET